MTRKEAFQKMKEMMEAAKTSPTDDVEDPPPDPLVSRDCEGPSLIQIIIDWFKQKAAT